MLNVFLLLSVVLNNPCETNTQEAKVIQFKTMCSWLSTICL